MTEAESHRMSEGLLGGSFREHSDLNMSWWEVSGKMVERGRQLGAVMWETLVSP